MPLRLGAEQVGAGDADQAEIEHGRLLAVLRHLRRGLTEPLDQRRDLLGLLEFDVTIFEESALRIVDIRGMYDAFRVDIRFLRIACAWMSSATDTSSAFSPFA